MSGLRSASLIVLVTFALVKGKNRMDSFPDKLTGSIKSHLANLHYGAYFWQIACSLGKFLFLIYC